MPRADLNELQAFLAVARERSFTRTTRCVAPTEAGERLFCSVAPYYPSRRQHTPAFALLIEALRWGG